MYVNTLLNSIDVTLTSEITKSKMEEKKLNDIEKLSSLELPEGVTEEIKYDREGNAEIGDECADEVKDRCSDTVIDTMTPAEAIFSQNNDMQGTNSVKVSFYEFLQPL